jgi:hypothetical protein
MSRHRASAGASRLHIMPRAFARASPSLVRCILCRNDRRRSRRPDRLPLDGAACRLLSGRCPACQRGRRSAFARALTASTASRVGRWRGAGARIPGRPFDAARHQGRSGLRRPESASCQILVPKAGREAASLTSDRPLADLQVDISNLVALKSKRCASTEEEMNEYGNLQNWYCLLESMSSGARPLS